MGWSGATTRAPTEILTDSSIRTVVCEIDNLDLATFCKAAAEFGSAHYGYVVTPNVDHLIRYYEDPSFRALYHAAQYVLLDSRVAALAMRLLNGSRLVVCTGADLTAHLLEHVASAVDPIVLVGGDESQAKEIAASYGLSNVQHHNPPMEFIANAEATETCLRFIEAQSPFRLCFLAVGSPQQEMIAQRLQARGKARGLVLCVGASLNFLTGVERRAPRWMQRLALEWLYRLVQDPKRLARRYLVRGPRVFQYLLSGHLVLRPRRMGKGSAASHSSLST